MSIGTAFQLFTLALKLANWITTQIDRAEWEENGYNKAAVEQMKALQINLGLADEAVKAANTATPAERKAILECDL